MKKLLCLFLLIGGYANLFAMHEKELDEIFKVYFKNEENSSSHELSNAEIKNYFKNQKEKTLSVDAQQVVLDVQEEKLQEVAFLCDNTYIGFGESFRQNYLENDLCKNWKRNCCFLATGGGLLVCTLSFVVMCILLAKNYKF